MWRLLLTVALVGGLWWLLSLRSRPRGTRVETPPSPAAGAPMVGTDLMVACAHCGLHLPRRDAVAGAAGALYCSEAHRQAAGSAAPDA